VEFDFVDITGRRLYRYVPASNTVDFSSVDEDIGCVAAARDGGYVAGLRTGIWLLSEAGAKRRKLADNHENHATSRFNDGKLGPDGAFWVGSGAVLNLAMGVQPGTRLQITNRAGDRMVQIQPNRFHYNWKRVGGHYPSYSQVRQEFDQHLALFARFVEEEGLGPVVPSQWELTYVDYVPPGRGIKPHLRLNVGYAEAVFAAGGMPVLMPILGQDAEVASVKSIIAGEQYSTVYKDTRKLAGVAVTMADDVLNGRKPQVNNTTDYNNGKKVVPSFLLQPAAVDKNNYKTVLVDGGYYTQDQLK